MTREGLILRPGREGDAEALRRVAERDCAPPPEGDVLVAEVAGTPLAWIELETGRVAADPFHPTSDLVRLLELRARQLRAGGRPRRPLVSFRRRRRAAAATTA